MNIEDIEITDEYRKVFDLINDKTCRCIFVTGQGGTGKSTLIDLICSKIPGIPVLAPTGVAALNVGGQTIHSFFRIAPGLLNPEDVEPDRKKFDMFKRLEFLIIDEISMVRADLMDAINLSLQKNRMNKFPFGGVRVIAVGDLFQLPPIVSTKAEVDYLSDRYRTEFFMSSNIINETKLSIVELKKVYRQKDEAFIRLLSNIREGIDLEATLEKLNAQYNGTSDDEHITLTPDNRTTENINEYRLNNLDPMDEQTYEATIDGNFDAKRYPAPEKLRLRIGARVMFLKNDQLKRWVNGSLGNIVGLEPGLVRVELDDTDEIVLVGKETWEHKLYSYNSKERRLASNVTGSFVQIPLNLAWACTIHKSQGKTFSKVNIDITQNIFADGQLYVALSRCRSIQGIHITRPIMISDIRVNPLIKQFYDRVIRS